VGEPLYNPDYRGEKTPYHPQKAKEQTAYGAKNKKLKAE